MGFELGRVAPGWKGSQEGVFCCVSSSIMQLCFGNSSFTVDVF